MNDGALSVAGAHVARAPNALSAITHNPEAHPITVPVAVETFSVVFDRQHQFIDIAQELDLHSTRGPVLHRIAHRFLSDPIKLSRHKSASCVQAATIVLLRSKR